MRFGIDISHHQSTAGIPWGDLKRQDAFVYIRATYGTSRDRHVDSHVRAARDHGLDVGLYHFYRFAKGVDEQFEAFNEVSDSVHVTAGDLAPVLDLEADIGAHVAPEWSSHAEDVCLRMLARYGQTMVYITQREWGQLGRPEWVLRRPLWVAHYTQRPTPATPADAPWTIWQYRVGPYDTNMDLGHQKGEERSRGALDHNKAQTELPRIKAMDERPGKVPTTGLSKNDWDAMRAERDREVQGE